MPIDYEDETLPYTPTDAGIPFVFQPGVATSSLFNGAMYPKQAGGMGIGYAGEYRGLYGTYSAPSWHPEWSRYRASRPTTTHWGVDIYAPAGIDVVAVVAGELSFANDPKLGLFAVLAFEVSGRRFSFHYGHLASNIGGPRSVQKGAVIGKVGCSGNADANGICSATPQGLGFTSSHVHFALVPPPAGPTAPKRSDPLAVLGWTLQDAPRPAFFSGA